MCRVKEEMQKSDARRQTPDDSLTELGQGHRSTLKSWQATNLYRIARNAGLFQSEIVNRKSKMCSRGQALTEYVIIAGLLMASLGILTVFFVTFKEYGGRILALVSSEYP